MINQIRIENFRSIKSATVFLPSFGAIVGKNASGKTNLLNALEAMLVYIKIYQYIMLTKLGK